ncbi:hypothetical protein [Geotalea sp. SG265]|uniref:hypothetical protein n=1 Tax=Geotalea sp. SG265 TaxID=2922867 RepID=UPI001FAF855E|nr:hypothetical protein [Geotalea sp. SG265]
MFNQALDRPKTKPAGQLSPLDRKRMTPYFCLAVMRGVNKIGGMEMKFGINVMMGLFFAAVFGLAGCGGGGGNAPNNKVTAAEAGPTQNVVAASIVTLDGKN